MLHTESGIAVALIKQRGYTSIEYAGPLRKLGYSEATVQSASRPLIPLWSVIGNAGGRQRGRAITLYRPDVPRPDPENKKKIIRYQNPPEIPPHLDCHPSQVHKITDPTVPLWITEGVKKGDALATHDAVAIDLPGVANYQARSNWRSGNM